MSKTNALAAGLEAVRAAAKAHNAQLANQAAPAAAPSAAWPPKAADTKQAQPVRLPRSLKSHDPLPPKNLQQFNVRLSPSAKERLRAAALNYRMSDQEFVEAWAMSLPKPEPVSTPTFK